MRGGGGGGGGDLGMLKIPTISEKFKVLYSCTKVLYMEELFTKEKAHFAHPYLIIFVNLKNTGFLLMYSIHFPNPWTYYVIGTTY